MPSSPTSSLRIEKQATGEGTNVWGDKLDSAFDKFDASVAGWLTKALTGNYSLTTANYSADEASQAMLKFTGTGAFAVTIPAVSKRYDVWNGCSGTLTLTNGSSSIAVLPGEKVAVVTDGGSNIARVQPTDFGGAVITSVGTPVNGTDACTKAYADALAFSSGSGSLPGQAGNSGKFLTTNGSTASWGSVVPFSRQILGGGLAAGGGDLNADRTITVTAATGAQVAAGTSSTVAVTPAALANSAAAGALTDATTIAWDLSTNGYNAKVTLGGNRTIGAPTGLFDGCPVSIWIKQDATGGRSPSFNAIWDFGSSGTPSINTTANKYTLISGVYFSDTGKIHAANVWQSA